MTYSYRIQSDSRLHAKPSSFICLLAQDYPNLNIYLRGKIKNKVLTKSTKSILELLELCQPNDGLEILIEGSADINVYQLICKKIEDIIDQTGYKC